MTTFQSVASPLIYSTFADDPDLGPIVDMFVKDLAERIAAMEKAAIQGDWTTLERLAHQIKGAAGSYGFPEATPVAANLESAVHERQSAEEIMLFLYETINFCSRLRSRPAFASS